MARRYWKEAGVDHKIDLKIGLALDSLDTMLLDSNNHCAFDFAFIDGNKSLYTEYIEKILPLIKKGGFLMIDNVLWMGKVIDKSARTTDPETREIYESVTNALADPRLDTHSIAIADGLTIIKIK